MSSNRLSVLMILDSVNVGGTETHVYTICQTLLKLGHRVTIVGKRGEMTSLFRDLGCKVYLLNIKRKRLRVNQLYRIVQKEKVDIMHGHMSPSGMLGSYVASKLRIPFYFTVHGTYYGRNKLQKILPRCSRVISVSPPVKEWLLGMGFESELLPNGIDLERFTSKKLEKDRINWGISDNAPLILYAARLKKEKGQLCNHLIDACLEFRKQYADLQFWVIGDGPEKEKLQKKADLISKNSNSSWIRFFGNRWDMPTYYSLSDVVIGTGRVALEGMSCGRPVIAVGSRGISGIVESKYFEYHWNHYFGDHRDADLTNKESLLPYLTKLFRDNKLRQDLGEEGRKIIEEKFDIQMITKRLIEIYKQ